MLSILATSLTLYAPQKGRKYEMISEGKEIQKTLIF
jgi:hypothetical protein